MRLALRGAHCQQSSSSRSSRLSRPHRCSEARRRRRRTAVARRERGEAAVSSLSLAPLPCGAAGVRLALRGAPKPSSPSRSSRLSRPHRCPSRRRRRRPAVARRERGDAAVALSIFRPAAVQRCREAASSTRAHGQPSSPTRSSRLSRPHRCPARRRRRRRSAVARRERGEAAAALLYLAPLP